MKFTWDEYLLKGAQWASTKSKDPSTKVGALIARPDHSVVATGFNGFPRGIADFPERLNDRPTKYAFIVHAEINAILTAKQNLFGCTLYVWPFMPCDRCFVQVIQTGINRVVFPKATEDQESRWGEAFNRVRALAIEAAIELVELKGN